MVMAQQLTFSAIEGREVELRSMLNDMVVQVSAEKGCLKYELYQMQEQRVSFFLVEIWKSKSRYRKHKESEMMQHFKDAMAPLLLSQNTSALKLTQCLTQQNYWSEDSGT